MDTERDNLILTEKSRQSLRNSVRWLVCSMFQQRHHELTWDKHKHMWRIPKSYLLGEILGDHADDEMLCQRVGIIFRDLFTGSGHYNPSKGSQYYKTTEYDLKRHLRDATEEYFQGPEWEPPLERLHEYSMEEQFYQLIGDYMINQIFPSTKFPDFKDIDPGPAIIPRDKFYRVLRGVGYGTMYHNDHVRIGVAVGRLFRPCRTTLKMKAAWSIDRRIAYLSYQYMAVYNKKRYDLEFWDRYTLDEAKNLFDLG